MTKIEEKIVKWEQIKICYETWLDTLAAKYRLGETIYTQAGQIFSAIVDDLKSLNKHTGAITEEAHLANTVLGDVCPHCRKSVRPVIYRASSSETGDVGQNLGDIEPLIKGESPFAWDW